MSGKRPSSRRGHAAAPPISPRPPDGETARRALGSVLRRLRETHPDAPSQERLGEWADLHRNYVGSAERGERNVAFEALTRWVAALGVTWAEFGAAVDLTLAAAASTPDAQR